MAFSAHVYMPAGWHCPKYNFEMALLLKTTESEVRVKLPRLEEVERRESGTSLHTVITWTSMTSSSFSNCPRT